MSYEKTEWVNDVTALSAENMNKIEEGIANAYELPKNPTEEDVGKYLKKTSDGVEWATVQGGGSGSVNTVNDVSPDANGNVTIYGDSIFVNPVAQNTIEDQFFANGARLNQLDETSYKIKYYDDIDIEITSTSYFTFSNNADGNTCTITAYNDSGSTKLKKVVIPYKNDDGKLVTHIGNSCFYNNLDIEEVIMPNSITHIDDGSTTTGAFYNCGNLKKLKFSNVLEFIGEYSFMSTTSISEYILPNSITHIGKYGMISYSDVKTICAPKNLIAYTSSYTTGYTFAVGAYEKLYFNCKNTTIIPQYCFANTANIKALYMTPVSEIKGRAFNNINTLTDVYYASSEEDYPATISTTGESADESKGNKPFRNATFHYMYEKLTAEKFPTAPIFNSALGGKIFSRNGFSDFSVVYTTPADWETSYTNYYIRNWSWEDEVLETPEGFVVKKQDKLTAGQNITIENNVISATGGKVPADIVKISETDIGGLNEFTVQNLSDFDYISIAMYIPAGTASWGMQVHISYDNDTYIFTGSHGNVVQTSARDNIYHLINMGAAGWEMMYTNHAAYLSPTHDYGNIAGSGNIIIQHPKKIKSIRCNLYQSASNLFPTGTTVTVCGK